MERTPIIPKGLERTKIIVAAETVRMIVGATLSPKSDATNRLLQIANTVLEAQKSKYHATFLPPWLNQVIYPEVITITKREIVAASLSPTVYSIFLNRSLKACSLINPSASCWS